MKHTFTCLTCGVEFTPKDSHINREHLFCSRICSSINFSRTHPRKTNKEYAEKHFSIPGNREKKRAADRAYAEQHREEARIKASKYYYANKIKISEKNRSDDAMKARHRAYYHANKDRMRENHTKWCAKQRKENPLYRLHDNLTSVIGACLKGNKCGKRTERLLGYSINDLKLRIERKFLPGMAWENYGRWHLDHIVPLCAFNFSSTDDIDFKRAWALSNLQPLWAKDNLRKNGRIDRPFQPSLTLAA